MNSTAKTATSQAKSSDLATSKVPPQPIDTEKLSAAMTAALRILRNDPTVKAKVTKRGEK